METASPGSGMLEALVAVGRRQGLDMSVEAVRRRFVVQDHAIGNSILISLAAELGLQARAIRVGWRDLPRLSKVLPAILKLRDGAAVILEAVVDNPNTGQ